jgi:hypothetical protein
MSNFPQIGDRVQWMAIKHGKNTIQFSTRTGTVFEIGPTLAGVRFNNGRETTVEKRRLRSMNEKSPVNDVFGALTESTKKIGAKSHEA